MPIVFEFLYFLVSHFNFYSWYDNFKQEIILFSVLLFIDYIIEFIYLIIIKKNIGIWIFSNSFNDEYGSYSMFVFLAITYIIITVFLGMLLDFFDRDIPITHTIFLIIFFIIFCFTETSYIHECQDDNIFTSLSYQEETETIYLRTMGDGHETSGEINGRSTLGAGYIHGKTETNYNLYYSFVGENGKISIRSIPYDEDKVNIYEITDKSDPPPDYFSQIL